MCSPADLCLAILAVVFPPLPVWIKRGLCSADSLINLGLCLLGFLPGLVHAWYIISVTPTAYEQLQDVERGHGHGHGGQVQHHHHFHGEPQPQRREGLVGKARQQKGYGAVAVAGAPQQQLGAAGSVNASSGSGAGQIEAPPPPYVDALKGDHKVQSS